MNYPDSVQFLYALGNENKTAKFGLERISAVLEALGAPHRAGRFVHVAGTNGKGSTCAMIESGLRAAGVRPGLFTSPHLLEPTERIRIQGRPISPRDFVSAFNRVHDAAEALLREGRIDLHTTYFETVTAMAFLVFAGQEIEITVLEVGLGGRLDATNVVHPALAVVTPVDFDHEAWLGKSLSSIAFEKAGILKPGAPAVFAAQRPEAARVLEARALELGVEVTYTSEWQVSGLELHPRGSRFHASRNGVTVAVDCPLAGEHQVQNALTAVAALARLGMPASAIEQGIAQASWPGRLERVSDDPEILLDGAHNPAGARALAAYLDRFYAGRPVWMIYGAMRDKAVAEMIGILFPRASHVIATAPGQARAVLPETIRELSGHPSIEVAPCLADALIRLHSLPPGAAVFITGSLFLVSEAKAALTRKAAIPVL
ncbi:MAG TPA: folylpolyglutamate synthase/dihydrofolate synthase family protein [Bryobacteraceae bacterium]|nr:folylpolyglutamate synthase/dihydrofolate synthase family protein [Bryobacteraceae bacterium]